MIRACLIFIVLPFIPCFALAQSTISPKIPKWTMLNTILEVSYLSVNVIDGLLTIDGTQKLGLIETSWALKEQPTKEEMLVATSLVAVLHFLIAVNTDEPYRIVFQMITLITKVYAVDNNIRLGALIVF